MSRRRSINRNDIVSPIPPSHSSAKNVEPTIQTGDDKDTFIERLKKLPILVSIYENAIAALITIFFLFLLSPLKDQLPEPFGTKDNFSYYFSLELVSQLEDKKNSPSPAIDDFTSIVIKSTQKPINIESINIRGIEKLKRCVVVTRDEQDNAALLKVNCTLNSTKQMVNISNIGSINKYTTLSANIWGDSSTDMIPLIQLTDGTVVWPEEERLVGGRILFLSDYWRLIITLIVLVMLGYYYVLKSRIHIQH